MRVQHLELAGQPAQGVVDDGPDRPRQVIRRHPRLEVDVTEQVARPSILAPHPLNPHLVARLRQTYQIIPSNATFSAAC
jgi:hypothetical protein